MAQTSLLDVCDPWDAIHLKKRRVFQNVVPPTRPFPRAGLAHQATLHRIMVQVVELFQLLLIPPMVALASRRAFHRRTTPRDRPAELCRRTRLEKGCVP